MQSALKACGWRGAASFFAVAVAISVSTPDASAAELPEWMTQPTFPAQQRAAGDPERIARGQALYGINCRSCHGVDLRGGDIGGPNLLRSQLVLSDEAGELILPVVKQGRSTPGATPMPALPLPDADILAVAEYIHSVVATSRPQGAPPPGTEVALDIVVGNARKGKRFFDRECTACHSVTGDLRNIASRINSAENLQNSWVAGRRWGPPDPDATGSTPRTTVVVTMHDGQRIEGELKRLDDFTVSLVMSDGRYRSFARTAGPGVASISINDPLIRHRKLRAQLSDDTMHDVTAYLATLK
ncbi:MAG: c-type cytochrome [Gammaproteobacteria bacterium]|nr:c-type cytochrome [Gammaproteobacteria bacterium]